MSIVALRRMSLVGFTADKARVLDELQALGCIEIIARRRHDAGDAAGTPTAKVREALKFLLECPQRRRQFVDTRGFDAPALQARALALQHRLHGLHDEVDALREQLDIVRPWGDFEFPAAADLGALRLWFYRTPHHRLAEFAALDEPWEVVRRDHANCYVVVISPHEPEDAPVARERFGERSRRELEQRLQEAEIEVEEAQEQRAQLSHWCTLLARKLAMLEDQAERSVAARQTEDLEPLFALEAWVPAANVPQLERYALDRGMALQTREPARDENPPTRLDNPRVFDAGEALVTFYMTPGYWSWDPSSTVLVSFAVFFAMILSDAGYAALLALALTLAWRGLGHGESARGMRVVAALSLFFSLVYGVLVGSYFGVAPAADGVLARAAVINLGDSRTMMTISVAIGVLHVTYASLRDAWRLGVSWAALAPLGWAAAISGSALYAAAAILGVAWAAVPGTWMAGGGLLLVFLFSAAGERLTPRVLKGLLALTRVSGAFGDILSYLRLFALGLASASLASAFNQMASDIRQDLPGVGLFLALCVLALGHALNLMLGVASAVIHGLRLNVIEFFNWGLTEEGKLFRPFTKKEK